MRCLPTASIILAGLATLALAHSGATGIVKERMDAMSEVADSMKALAAIVRATGPVDVATAGGAAKVIAGHAGQIPAFFPEGSHSDVSEALPTIWTDWEGFTAIAGNLEQAALALEAAANDGDRTALATAFRSAGETCQACHEKYRLKKEQ